MLCLGPQAPLDSCSPEARTSHYVAKKNLIFLMFSFSSLISKGPNHQRRFQWWEREERVLEKRERAQVLGHWRSGVSWGVSSRAGDTMYRESPCGGVITAKGGHV